uniref:Reverse transcriptase zinc-binding domain-containing protein n=1 Tax=Hordeum vulgare subsp. vulgare TaxID=112509 RepID=A0A8I6WDL2_HORVV
MRSVEVIVFCLGRECVYRRSGGLGILNLKWFGSDLHCRWPWLRWDPEEIPWRMLPNDQEGEVTAIFSAATSVCLGDGERAKFWTDNWLPEGGSIATMSPSLLSFVKKPSRTVRDALQNRSWVRDISRGDSVLAIAQYLTVWDITQNILLTPGVPDHLQWKLNEDHLFSVKSAYNMFFLASVRFACYKLIWKSKAPPRCKFFMWLVVHRRFLIADNLERRGWPSNGYCPLCLVTPVDCTHVFVHCRFTQQVWLLFRDWTRTDFQVPEDRFSNTEDWWLQARKLVPKPMRRNFDTISILIH